SGGRAPGTAMAVACTGNLPWPAFVSTTMLVLMMPADVGWTATVMTHRSPGWICIGRDNPATLKPSSGDSTLIWVTTSGVVPLDMRPTRFVCRLPTLMLPKLTCPDQVNAGSAAIVSPSAGRATVRLFRSFVVKRRDACRGPEPAGEK